MSPEPNHGFWISTAWFKTVGGISPVQDAQPASRLNNLDRLPAITADAAGIDIPTFLTQGRRVFS